MSVRRLPGLTLVELAITVSVAVVLLAAAIPQFSSLERRQELYLQLQRNVADCLQYAQSQALAPGPDTRGARFLAAQIQSNGCRVFAVNEPFDTLTAAGQGTEVTPKSYTLQGVILRCVVAGNQTINSFPARVYFGVAERGVPVAVVTGNGSSTTATVKPPLGTGIRIGVQGMSASSNGQGLKAAVTVQQFGTPIKVEKLDYGC